MATTAAQEDAQNSQPMDVTEKASSYANSSKKGLSTSLEVPWIEKYRPLVLADIVGNEETVKRLGVISQIGNMPNLIISGAPGIGKTTSVLCLARSLLGNLMKDAVLELNASDDRGIDVVRNKIKMFAQRKVQLPPGKHKLVILDEADSMTASAQQAMRRTMELYSSTTRFALACNNSEKIIEPIQSRCAILRYSMVTDKEILGRLLDIIDKENIKYTDSGLEAVIFTAQGDMRRAINNMQSTCAGFGMITAENVFKVCDQPHPMLVRKIIESCMTRNIDEAVKGLSELWAMGYAAIDISSTFFRVTKQVTMPEYVKLEFLKEIGITQARVVDGLGTFLQLQGLLARMCKITQK